VDFASGSTPIRLTVEPRLFAIYPDAIQALSQRDPKRLQTKVSTNDFASVHFLFPGQGSQYPNMGRQVTTPSLSSVIGSTAAANTSATYGSGLAPLALSVSRDVPEDESTRVTDTVIAQPAIFTVEYALAQLWLSWGIQPQGMLGHSVGEFVAACLAGVFSLEDALGLIAARGRMMQEVAPGGMLSDATLGVRDSCAAEWT